MSVSVSILERCGSFYMHKMPKWKHFCHLLNRNLFFIFIFEHCVYCIWLAGWLCVCLSVICIPSIILIISRDNKYSLACSPLQMRHMILCSHFFASFLHEKFVLYPFFTNDDENDDRDFYFVYWANQLFASPACRYPFKIFPKPYKYFTKSI